MIAVCIPVELKATAFCKIFRGTSKELKIAEQAFEKNASVPKKRHQKNNISRNKILCCSEVQTSPDASLNYRQRVTI